MWTLDCFVEFPIDPKTANVLRVISALWQGVIFCYFVRFGALR